MKIRRVLFMFLVELPLMLVITYPVIVVSYLWQFVLAGWYYGEDLYQRLDSSRTPYAKTFTVNGVPQEPRQ